MREEEERGEEKRSPRPLRVATVTGARRSGWAGRASAWQSGWCQAATVGQGFSTRVKGSALRDFAWRSRQRWWINNNNILVITIVVVDVDTTTNNRQQQLPGQSCCRCRCCCCCCWWCAQSFKQARNPCNQPTNRSRAVQNTSCLAIASAAAA